MGVKSYQSRQSRVSEVMSNDRYSQTRKSMQRDQSKVKIETKIRIEKDLPEDLYSISGQKANQLAYKSMNPCLYYSLTVFLYAVEVVLSITLNDIG